MPKNINEKEETTTSLKLCVVSKTDEDIASLNCFWEIFAERLTAKTEKFNLNCIILKEQAEQQKQVLSIFVPYSTTNLYFQTSY